MSDAKVNTIKEAGVLIGAVAGIVLLLATGVFFFPPAETEKAPATRPPHPAIAPYLDPHPLPPGADAEGRMPGEEDVPYFDDSEPSYGN